MKEADSERAHIGAHLECLNTRMHMSVTFLFLSISPLLLTHHPSSRSTIDSTVRRRVPYVGVK